MNFDLSGIEVEAKSPDSKYFSIKVRSTMYHTTIRYLGDNYADALKENKLEYDAISFFVRDNITNQTPAIEVVDNIIPEINKRYMYVKLRESIIPYGDDAGRFKQSLDEAIRFMYAIRQVVDKYFPGIYVDRDIV